MFTKMISRLLPVFLSLVTALAVLIGSAAFPTNARAFGATITVNSIIDDTTPGNGFCTLREAINNANANSDSTSGDCAAGLAGSVDVIFFSSGLGSAIIRLGSTLPTITDTTGLTIDGGTDITLSGDTDGNGTGDVQLFSVSSSAPLTLANLTVEKGYQTFGGAITSNGLLTLQGVTMRNNASPDQAGAINQWGGTLTITASIFEVNTALVGAAAIRYSSGTILIEDSSFKNNTTSGPSSTYGAISGDGSPSLTIQRSTFDTNVAKYGGAIYFSGGTLNIENSTFSGNGNSTGGVAGAIYLSNGTMTIDNTTIANNLTNGIQLGATTTLNLHNTILADNATYDCYAYAGALTGSATNNLIETLAPSPGDCDLSTTVIPDLGLSPLADNGGPTRTRALLAGSPALDAGDNATCAATDQRGYTRPLDGNVDSIVTCDIGAYEVRPASTTTITSDAPDYSVSGASVTVNVSVSSASGVPSGTVDVTSPDSNCMITLTAGAGSCVLNPVTAGTQTITATYNGDLSHDPSADTEAHSVGVSVGFTSTGAQDGWVLESTETSGVGGTKNATGSTFQLSYDASNRQYRAILAFNTAGLPDNATVQSVLLKIKQSGAPVGGNPFNILGKLWVDIRTGPFSANADLQLGDFRATASAAKVTYFS